jgi:Mg2+-importing ATPase
VLRWLVGIATLVAVIIIATRFTQPQDFLHVVEHAQPWWIVVGLALQAGTYVAQASVYRAVVRKTRESLALKSAIRIALAKLFVDQTLPSGGLSGGALLVGALGKRGMAKPVVRATLVVSLASYYFAYAIGLTCALVIAAIRGHVTTSILVVSIVFITIATAVPFVVIALSSMEKLPKIRGIERAARWLTQADDRLTHDTWLQVRATAFQLAIIALDGATLWAMLRAVGAEAPIAAVFAAYMLASLARTLAFTPGGLGVFEGAGVFALTKIGVHHAEALSATLLFRGLSYWLPMIPGFIASRGMR